LVTVVRELVILSEIHGSMLSEEWVRRVCGDDPVEEFLKKNPGIVKSDGYIGRGSRRDLQQKKDISQKKLDLARRALQSITWIPWIRFAGVTGSVAFENAHEKDDIDIFVITANNRVWLTRLVEEIVLRIRGVRRSFRDRNVADRLCINYYLSEGMLKIQPPKELELMNALELVRMTPVLYPAYTKTVLDANPWVYEYFPGNLENGFPRKNGRPSFSGRIHLFSFLVDGCDFVVMVLQKLYMRVMQHIDDGAVLERNRIIFFDQSRWPALRSKVMRQLERYHV